MNSGIIANVDVDTHIDMEESGPYIVTFFYDSSNSEYFLTVIPKQTFDINEVKEFTFSGARQHCFISVNKGGQDLMYFGTSVGLRFTPARSLAKDIRMIDFFVSRPTVFSEIVSDFEITDSTGQKFFSSFPTINANTTPFSIPSAVGITYTGSIFYSPFIQDEDFVKAFEGESFVNETIDFG